MSLPISHVAMMASIILKDQTYAHERYLEAVRNYSSAVEEITAVRDASIAEALMRAHEAHLELLALADHLNPDKIDGVRRLRLRIALDCNVVSDRESNESPSASA
jgi:hypothetical protein